MRNFMQNIAVRGLFVAASFALLLWACGGPDPAPKKKELPQRDDRADGPVESGGPWFVNEAKKRGVDLLNRTGKPGRKEFILGAVGPGAAVFDANGDGRLDVYIPNGNWLVGDRRTEFYGGDDRPRNALYIQQADGTFRNEAKERGVDDDAWGFGAVAADLDADGDQDLVVSNLGPNRLYINDGKGRFADVAVAAGVAGPSERGKWQWSTGIAVADFDRDGVLDLYIANYADMFKWMREYEKIKRDDQGRIIQARVCDWQRLKVYCGPLGLPAQQDHLFRGKGGENAAIRFEDVSQRTGIHRPEDDGGPKYGFQVLFTDVNLDGWLDIYVANDSVESFLFESRGDGTFEERGGAYGVAVGRNGDDQAGMGATTVDMNGDGYPDLLKTNFSLQTNNLYLSARLPDGRIVYGDSSERTGLRAAVYTALGWGVLSFDYDNDGDRDIYYANGHVYPEVDTPAAAGLNTSFEQLNILFRNDSTDTNGRRRLRYKEQRDAGPGLSVRKCSRGASVIDFDNDGDLDIVVINLNNTPDLLVNHRGAREGAWVKLRLTGDPRKKVNIEGIGSRVTVTAGNKSQLFETHRGEGFLGCGDPRVHVGLGRHKGPIDVEVIWPNGQKRTYKITNLRQTVELKYE